MKKSFESIINDMEYNGNPDVRLAAMYARKASDALDRGIGFTLSFSEYKKLKSRKTCYYTGYPFKTTKKNATNDDLMTLDRIDSDVGYTVENTVVCLKSVNAIKNTLFESGKHRVPLDLVEKLVSKLLDINFVPRSCPLPASNESLQKLVNKE